MRFISGSKLLAALLLINLVVFNFLAVKFTIYLQNKMIIAIYFKLRTKLLNHSKNSLRSKIDY